jgi:molybdenum cofactor cytidylyltransferase
MANIGAVILAAGESSRLGRSKQLIQFRGKSLVRRIVDAADEAGCSPIAVVIGSEGEKMARELEQTSAAIVENENWRNGIGTSIRTGVQSLINQRPDLDAVMLLVCDQPLVETEVIKQLIARYGETGKTIIASSYSGTLGVPALFGRSHFEELLTLPDDSGAKSIILSKRERVAEFPFPQGEIDLDTLADYERLIALNLADYTTRK